MSLFDMTGDVALTSGGSTGGSHRGEDHHVENADHADDDAP